MLIILKGGIKGYEFLYMQAGIIQCNISTGNLIINKKNNNPFWPAFLINFNLTIKEK